MIRVVLPAHLRTLAHVDGEVELPVDGPVTQRAVVDALESFAAGTPVIGTRLPGLEDLIDPGQTGWLVPPDAPVDLALAMQDAWQNVETSRRLGAQGRRFAQNFDWSVVAHRHIELYEELLAERTRRVA